MAENFTRRHRLDYVPSAPRHQDIPFPFRADLMKAIYEGLRESDAPVAREYALYRDFCLAINVPHELFYGEDDVNEHYRSDLLMAVVHEAQWHEALSIVEEAVKTKAITRRDVNKLFDYHNIGYEVVRGEGDGPRVEVKYGAVVAELADASVATAPYPEIAEMIDQSRKALVDPRNVNIADSISNSVKALEAYLKEWLSKRQGGARPLPTLGAVAKELSSKKLAPDNIVGSLEQLYILRNRESNVGHGSVAPSDMTASEALLIHEMAASFINYFHRLSE